MASKTSVLLEQENLLQYARPFASTDALALGNEIVRLSREYGDVGVRITRESDGVIVFQWMADDKSKRHYTFMEGKRLAAKACGHSSLFAKVDHAETGNWEALFEKDAPEFPEPGAFPIRSNGEWTATISICGLKNGKDHELAIRALGNTLGRQPPLN